MFLSFSKKSLKRDSHSPPPRPLFQKKPFKGPGAQIDFRTLISDLHYEELWRSAPEATAPKYTRPTQWDVC